MDYWISKPGKDGLKLDWRATFRNWVRSEKGTNGAAAAPKTTEEQAAGKREADRRYAARRLRQARAQCQSRGIEFANDLGPDDLDRLISEHDLSEIEAGRARA